MTKFKPIEIVDWGIDCPVCGTLVSLDDGKPMSIAKCIECGWKLGAE